MSQRKACAKKWRQRQKRMAYWNQKKSTWPMAKARMVMATGAVTVLRMKKTQTKLGSRTYTKRLETYDSMPSTKPSPCVWTGGKLLTLL